MKIKLFLLFFIFSGIGKAQNLVSNGSFEVSTCNPNQFVTFSPYHALDWYSPTSGTPDYFMDGNQNEGCYITDVNSAGFQMLDEWQYPQEGTRMAGIYAHLDMGCVREYLQTKLIVPMQTGRKYCVGYYVSLSNKSLIAVDRLGVAFTVDSLVDYSVNCPLGLQPQLLSPPGVMLADTMGWTLVQGEYTATGGERFLTLGNFFLQEEVNFIPFDGTGNINSAYYYIDNIIVEDCTQPVGVDEENVFRLAVWPNPSDGRLFVSCPVDGVLCLRDMTGKLVYTDSVQAGRVTLMPGDVAPGVYTVRVTTANGICLTEKLLVH